MSFFRQSAQQTHDAIDDAPVPNLPTHPPGNAELPADVDLHDVQHVAVRGRRAGCCPWLLPVRVEEVGNRGRY